MKMVYSAVAAIGIAFASPVAAQAVIVDEDTVRVVPMADPYDEPGAVRYYSAPRRFYDDDRDNRTANEINPNDTDDFYRQMDREGRSGATQ